MDEMADTTTDSEQVEYSSSGVDSTVDVSEEGESPSGVAAGGDDQFYDQELSAELHEERSRMRDSFRRKAEKNNQVKREYEQLKQHVATLQNDNNAAMTYINNRFPGYHLVPSGAKEPEQAPQGGSVLNLGPGLEFMEEPLRKGVMALVEEAVGPVRHQQQQQRQHSTLEQLQGLSATLADRVPTWEDEKDKMIRLQNFIRSNDLVSKEFGSKLDVLFDGATKNQQVASGYAKHMRTVANNRTATSKAPPGKADFESMILTSPMKDAVQLAFDKAKKGLGH